jgi:hypothetical protein
MDLRKSLIEGDPVAREPELDAFHAQTMRQRVLLEARNTERVEREGLSRAFGEREGVSLTEREGVSLTEREGVSLTEREGFSRAWLQPVAVATAVAACLVAGVAVGLRIQQEPGVGRPFQSRQDAAPSTRQMQFSTPGGTRIIWTFHQEFDL